MSTNVRFLEDDHMMSNKTKGKVNLREPDETPITTSKTMDLIPTILIFSTQVSRCSEKVIVQPNQFMYLGEFFEVT